MQRIRLGLIAGAVLGVSALGQSATPCLSSGIGAFAGMNVGVSVGQSSVGFTATLKTTFDQKLAEGNSIHTEYTTHQARDSAGRTRQESAQGCRRGEDGQPRLLVHVMVHDPEAASMANWTEGASNQAGQNVVNVFHFPSPAASVPMQRRPNLPTRTGREQQSSPKSEDLGTRYFAGVQAQGTRTVQTIAAGAEGNTLALQIVTEVWMSHELNLLLMHVHDDPRRGRTVTEVTELTRGEPDPALFTPPAGYTVREQGTNQQP